MGKAEDLLTEIIEKKDSKIERLQNKIEQLKSTLDVENWAWQRHKHFPDNEFYSGIPFPRLEMKLSRLGNDWYEVLWEYGIVYKSFADVYGDNKAHYNFIPIGSTTGRGGDGKIEHWMNNDGQINRPFRDGVHINADRTVFNLPAYISCEELHIIHEIKFDNEIDSKIISKLKYSIDK